MGCNIKNDDKNKRSAVLTFARAELIYDASNYAWVEGDVMKTDDDHDRHQLQDIAQAGNIDLVTRVLNRAHQEATEMLYAHTKADIPEKEPLLRDKLVAPKIYIIELSIPESFSMTTVRLLEVLVHDYMVYRVIADWVGITYPDRKAEWESKLAIIKEQIQSALKKRSGHIHRPLKPF